MLERYLRGTKDVLVLICIWALNIVRSYIYVVVYSYALYLRVSTRNS